MTFKNKNFEKAFKKVKNKSKKKVNIIITKK